MHPPRHRRHGVSTDRGAAAVEFGLLLPLVLLIVLGIIDFGGMMHSQVTITQAAREGARVAALQQVYDYGDIESRTKAAAVSPLVDGNINVDAPENCPGGDDAVVTVTHEFTFITPVGAIGTVFGGGGFGMTTNLSATGVMPCET